MHNTELLIFLIMGILIMFVQNKIHHKLKKIGKANFWPNGLLVLIANLFIAFGLLWAVSSLAEHETQAAMMGILIFSGFGVIMAIIAYRVISNEPVSENPKNDKISF